MGGGYLGRGLFQRGNGVFLMGRKEIVVLCLVGRGIYVLRINPWNQEFLSAFFLNST